MRLQNDYQLWCAGNLQVGYEPIRKDQLNNGMFNGSPRSINDDHEPADLLIFKTQADKKSWAKPDAYEE